MKRTIIKLAQQTLRAGQERGITRRAPAEDHLLMDGLFRELSLSYEAQKPIMEVIDEAVEESGVRGVLVGAHGLVRRHRDHGRRPAGAGVRNDPLAGMGGRARSD